MGREIMDKVSLVSDDDGHEFVIPATLHSKFYELLNKMIADDYNDQEIVEKFDELFDEYRFQHTQLELFTNWQPHPDEFYEG